MIGYEHGWQACRVCHAAAAEITIVDRWHLRANPGYWGSRSPHTLVLGFSKGANQLAAAQRGQFDAVAFAGARKRLAQILQVLQIDLEGQSLDTSLSSEGTAVGVASLVRCGMSILKDDALVTSGTIMTDALREPVPRSYMSNCISRHLIELPPTVRQVILLGNSDGYVAGVKSLMEAQFADYRNINNVAFHANGRTWVFAAHPAPGNGHFGTWLEADESTGQGRKRKLAQVALGISVASGPVGAAADSPPVGFLPKIDSTPQVKQNVVAANEAIIMGKEESRFATSFHLLNATGRKLYPVRIKDRDTGRMAFRVSRQGNTKSDSREIMDETELLRLCETGTYAVRVAPLAGGAASLVKPGVKAKLVRSVGLMGAGTPGSTKTNSTCG